jgi:hypothetical protein
MIECDRSWHKALRRGQNLSIRTGGENDVTDADRDYFQKRATAELALAARSQNPAAVERHHALAGHYLDRLRGQDVRNRAELA